MADQMNEHPSGAHRDFYDKDEKKFLRQHRLAGAGSSFSFAAAGALLIGVAGTLVTNVFSYFNKIADNQLKREAGEKIKPWEEAKLFKGRKIPMVMAGFMAAGAGFMLVSNWLESKKTLLEWRMGGKKMRGAVAGDAQEKSSSEVAYEIEVGDPDTTYLEIPKNAPPMTITIGERSQSEKKAPEASVVNETEKQSFVLYVPEGYDVKNSLKELATKRPDEGWRNKETARTSTKDEELVMAR